MKGPDELRNILRSARPSGQDDTDPAIQAARDAAASMPVIVGEIAAERVADAAIARAVREVAPPPGLEGRLIDAVRATRRQAEPQQPWPVLTRTSTVGTSTAARGWNRRQWLGWAAAAAVSAVTGGLIGLRQRKEFTLENLTRHLMAITRSGVALSFMSMNRAAVLNWMHRTRAPRAEELPPSLDAIGRKGCHVYYIAGHAVSLECFVFPDMRELHLFATPAASLRGAPTAGQPPSVLQREEFTIGIWTHGKVAMVIVTREALADLRALLA